MFRNGEEIKEAEKFKLNETEDDFFKEICEIDEKNAENESSHRFWN